MYHKLYEVSVFNSVIPQGPLAVGASCARDPHGGTHKQLPKYFMKPHLVCAILSRKLTVCGTGTFYQIHVTTNRCGYKPHLPGLGNINITELKSETSFSLCHIIPQTNSLRYRDFLPNPRYYESVRLQTAPTNWRQNFQSESITRGRRPMEGGRSIRFCCSVNPSYLLMS
jgi:hypothetical protein